MSTALALVLALGGGVAWAGANDDLVKATKLPVQADALRKAGVPDAEVAEAVRTAEAHGLSASEAEEVLEEGAEAGEEHGNIDNFGKFVNDRLDEGLRGRDLAAAIHAEHENRGKGPKGKGKGHDKHGSDHPGKGKGHDKHGDGAEGAHPGKGKGHDKHGSDHPGKGKGHDKHGDGAEGAHPGKGKHGAGKGKSGEGSGKGHGQDKKDKSDKGKGKGKKK